MAQPYQILLIGLGVLGISHLTKEAEQALSLCTEIFLLHPDGDSVAPHLRSLGPQVTDLTLFYKTRVHGEDLYKKIAKYVLDRANSENTIALAVYGHPSFLVEPHRLIVEGARSLGLRTKSLVGISSIDCIFLELDIDVSDGVGIYNATDLVSRQQPIYPHSHVLIFQPGDLSLPKSSRDAEHKKGLRGLMDHLLTFYSSAHPLAIVFVSPNPFFATKITNSSVGNLSESEAALHGGATLYIPPAERAVNQIQAESDTHL